MIQEFSGDLLKGKVVVITGAGGGIGNAEAIVMAAQGASIVVNDIGVGQVKSNPHHSADKTFNEIKMPGAKPSLIITLSPPRKARRGLFKLQ
jgi:NAD(P)-dependent dehydrogenase (short-subunit alcohol dehydrogenase family)